MANRRMLVKDNKLHQNVVVSACATKSTAETAKARYNANKSLTINHFRDKTAITLFISLTIVSCLIISNCLSCKYSYKYFSILKTL